MCTLLSIACSVTCHGKLSHTALYLMRYLGCERYLAVDIATQADGNQLIGIRGKVLAGDASTIAFVTVTNNC